MNSDRSSACAVQKKGPPAGQPARERTRCPGCFHSSRRDEKRSGAGFTLLELMIVIAILGALSAISIPMYVGYLQKARMTKATADIYSLERMLKTYQIDLEVFPESLADIGQQKLKDPWGKPYQYLNIQDVLSGNNTEGNPRKDRFLHPINNDFDLFSMGADGNSEAELTAKSSQDDVIRASDGAFVGRAAEY